MYLFLVCSPYPTLVGGAEPADHKSRVLGDSALVGYIVFPLIRAIQLLLQNTKWNDPQRDSLLLAEFSNATGRGSGSGSGSEDISGYYVPSEQEQRMLESREFVYRHGNIELIVHMIVSD